MGENISPSVTSTEVDEEKIEINIDQKSSWVKGLEKATPAYIIGLFSGAEGILNAIFITETINIFAIFISTSIVISVVALLLYINEWHRKNYKDKWRITAMVISTGIYTGISFSRLFGVSDINMVLQLMILIYIVVFVPILIKEWNYPNFLILDTDKKVVLLSSNPNKLEYIEPSKRDNRPPFRQRVFFKKTVPNDIKTEGEGYVNLGTWKEDYSNFDARAKKKFKKQQYLDNIIYEVYNDKVNWVIQYGESVDNKHIIAYIGEIGTYLDERMQKIFATSNVNPKKVINKEKDPIGKKNKSRNSLFKPKWKFSGQSRK